MKWVFAEDVRKECGEQDWIKPVSSEFAVWGFFPTAVDENKAQVARLVVTVTDYLEYRQVSSEEKNQYYTTSVSSEHRAQSTLSLLPCGKFWACLQGNRSYSCTFRAPSSMLCLTIEFRNEVVQNYTVIASEEKKSIWLPHIKSAVESQQFRLLRTARAAAWGQHRFYSPIPVQGGKNQHIWIPISKYSLTNKVFPL